MGRYQWELFVLAGFGWLADKYVLCRTYPSHYHTNKRPAAYGSKVLPLLSLP